MSGKAHNRADLVGEVFGSLEVLSYSGSNKHQKATWKCLCVCGAIICVETGSLRSANTKSCGCINRKRLSELSRTHGLTGTRSYRIWQAMHNRCRNKNQPNYKNYGGRGIKVCARWSCFENFLEDMGEPADGVSIDRIDNDGDYEPKNCRWATRRQQSRNMRTNRVIEFRGCKRPLIDWADDLGIDQSSLRERLERWPLEKALTQPRSR